MMSVRVWAELELDQDEDVGWWGVSVNLRLLWQEWYHWCVTTFELVVEPTELITLLKGSIQVASVFTVYGSARFDINFCCKLTVKH